MKIYKLLVLALLWPATLCAYDLKFDTYEKGYTTFVNGFGAGFGFGFDPISPPLKIISSPGRTVIFEESVVRGEIFGDFRLDVKIKPLQLSVWNYPWGEPRYATNDNAEFELTVSDSGVTTGPFQASGDFLYVFATADSPSRAYLAFRVNLGSPGADNFCTIRVDFSNGDRTLADSYPSGFKIGSPKTFKPLPASPAPTPKK